MHIALFAPYLVSLSPCHGAAASIPVSRPSQRAGSGYPAGTVSSRLDWLASHFGSVLPVTLQPALVAHWWVPPSRKPGEHVFLWCFTSEFRKSPLQVSALVTRIQHPFPSLLLPLFSWITRIVECSLHCSNAVRKQWCLGECEALLVNRCIICSSYTLCLVSPLEHTSARKRVVAVPHTYFSSFILSSKTDLLFP